MDSKLKVSLGVTVLLLAVIGIRIGLIYRQRQEVEHPAETVQTRTPPDELVPVRKLFPDSLADAKALIGKPLWVNAGGQMDYYPYSAHHADYRHAAGTLLGAERIDIQDAFEQVAPGDLALRIPDGDRQVLLAFTRPNDPKKYAVPVAYKEGKVYHFYTDDIFFYDDPHQLYSFWGPAIWAAVDRHQAIPGMSEHEVQMALGQVSTPEGNDYGNRSVTYYNLGKPFRVTFDHDKATTVTAQTPEK
jgi:hypothetical protein